MKGIFYFISGFLLGGVTGCVVMDRRLRRHIDEAIEENVTREMEELTKYYETKYSMMNYRPDQLDEASDEDGSDDKKSQSDEPSLPVTHRTEGQYVDYTEYSASPNTVIIPPEVKTASEGTITREENPPVTHVTHSESHEIDISAPQLIHQDTYYGETNNSKSSKEWNFATFTYYTGDDIVANDADNSIVKNWKSVLGREFKDHFGDEDFGNDENCVYVRNYELHTDFLITREIPGYIYAVLDFDDDEMDQSDMRIMYKEAEKNYREGDN